MFDTGAFPHIKGGKVRALAVAAERRHPMLPDVPTLEEEAGVKGMIMNAWYGVAAPAGTPPAVVTKVNAAVNHALAKFWRSEVDRYGALVKLTGATLD